MICGSAATLWPAAEERKFSFMVTHYSSFTQTVKYDQSEKIGGLTADRPTTPSSTLYSTNWDVGDLSESRWT